MATAISSISTLIDSVLGKIRTAAQRLPAELLLCTAMNRPGLSQSLTSSKIIENNGKIGLMTGAMPDGSPNLLNEYTYNIVNEVMETLKKDASIQVVIPVGGIMVTAEGANGGGSLTAVGTNTNLVNGYGIIR